ncbi:MAG: cation-transporting P-type ATPase [Pseudomonadota bacterium]
MQAEGSPGTDLPPHALGWSEVVAGLQSSVDQGLTSGDATARLARHGPNRLQARRPVSAVQLFLKQVINPVVLLLASAVAVALVFDDRIEAVAIGVVIAINTVIGFVTELRATRSMEALRRLGTLATRVRRDGRVMVLPAEDMVPGDIVLLEGGDAVTADLRLIEASGLSADEAVLTGESVPIDKGTGPVAPDAQIGDRACMAFKGTVLTRGGGIGVVVATGLQTELGQISALVAQASAEHSPLERQLQRLSGQLIGFVLALVAVLALVGVAQGRDPVQMIQAAIALAVAAIPEGLPVVATMALARGMWRMARQNALIERLAAVETLGATTVIFTDKTGTLTENRMEVREITAPDGTVVLSPDGGGFLAEGRAVTPDTAPWLDDILTAAVLCNNAALGADGQGHSGDPLEQALLLVGAVGGKTPALLQNAPKLQEIAFDSTTKMMATVHDMAGNPVMWVKGAPEAVLAASTGMLRRGARVRLTSADRADWAARTAGMAAQGMRVLAVAKRAAGDTEAGYADLTFLGLLSLYDPPRADVRDALAQCRIAGIRVIMMTGDHTGTARSIAEAVGLTEADPKVIEGSAVRPLAELDDKAADTLRAADIFARVTPAQKLDLIALHQRAGEIVAMTGDGVNDAPALKQADIGIAMGQRGTQVAREAADMVLRDDAFVSIVATIREGRAIFRNIQKSVVYLVSGNLSEVLIVGFAILLGLPLPLLPLQILFLNLVTDVFPAFALGVGEGHDGILERPPRDPTKPMVTRRLWIAVALHGLAISGATLAALIIARDVLGLEGTEAVTVSFLTLALAQLWHVFNMRDPQSPLFVNEVTRNPFVWGALALSMAIVAAVLALPVTADVLGLAMPVPRAWGLILGMSLVPLVAGQLGLVVTRHVLSQDVGNGDRAATGR